MTTPFSMYQVGAEALLPPRDISVSQWADENVVLTGSGSAERVGLLPPEMARGD